MDSGRFFVTTPIYYVNDVPHIGHAYTTIAADVLARHYAKKIGQENVFFLTGTDEHGAKIAEAAAKSNKSPQEFVDELAPKFKSTWDKLNINYSEFFRTTNPEHEKQVQDFVQKLIDNGFVEKRKYTGLYCVGCERYYTEDELENGCCPFHKKPPVTQSEENYFFQLSKFQKKLIEIIESGELKILPETRKNEILGKLKQNLEDVSISRTAIKWGIEFPGDATQTIYVWIDALLNYYTATKIYHKESFWPASLHLMAKDILWFHAVIWPAMLLAADLPLPKEVFAHGFFTIGGQKMSKSLGNVLDPNILADKFGADAIRYALLREFPFGEDGDISEEKVAKNYDFLANNIGNLLQRTIAMINRYEIKIQNSKIKDQNGSLKLKIELEKSVEQLDFMGGLKKIDEFAIDQNRLIAEKAPWELSKLGKIDELNEVLNTVCNNLVVLAEALEVFMPETAAKMQDQLKTLKPEPLFPKIES